MALIYYFSSLSGVPIPLLFSSQDFFLHIIEYSVLSYLLSSAFVTTGSRRGIHVYALLITVLYGATDELHQAFVPLRDPSLFDLIANAVGGWLGILVFHLFGNPDHHS